MGTSNVAPAPLPPPSKGSFRDLDPVEQGGRTARAGFEFQDHVAAGKCLDMILGGGPTEVWCEAEDDIVLVFVIQGVEWFEFVQVKGTDLGQAWTAAKLCEREPPRSGNGPGRCILEKSLAHDRADENCRFRVVTCWQPEALLAVLKLEIDNPARNGTGTEVAAVTAAIGKKFATPPASPNGNGIAFWAERTVWECRATIVDVRNENLLKLERVLDVAGQFLAPDQRQELYDRLFRRVQDASLACGRTQKQAKRLAAGELQTWLLGQAHAILHPAQAGTSTALEGKLTAAGVDPTSVEVAKEQRRRYLREARQSKYLSVDDRDFVEGEILARLHRLKTRLDAGELAHAARLLLLVHLCGVKNRVEGLTKLAKLDFFVRYPAFLRRAASDLEKKPQAAPTETVESEMVRHHYGPWDARYYQILAYLESRALLAVERRDKTFVFSLTDDGVAVARRLAGEDSFQDLCGQMKAVKKLLGGKSGDWLKKLVYRLFEEEVAQLPLGQVIRP